MVKKQLKEINPLRLFCYVWYNFTATFLKGLKMLKSALSLDPNHV